MLIIRPDQIELFERAAQEVTHQRFRRYVDETYGETCDASAFADDVLRVGDAIGAVADGELEELADVLAFFARWLEGHEPWREAAATVLRDRTRPLARRLGYVQRYIIPRMKQKRRAEEGSQVDD